MLRWAVIDKNYKVKNIVIWDGVSNWKPPVGCKVERVDKDWVGVGHLWDPDSKKFIQDILKRP